MSTIVPSKFLTSQDVPSAGLAAETDPRSLVLSLLVAHGGGLYAERRRDQRFAFPQLVRLVPLDEAGDVVEDEAVVVAGKHLSEKGLGFFHQEPLPYRRVLATFETTGTESVSLELDLSWCRFVRGGWYESGGRFIGIGRDWS